MQRNDLKYLIASLFIAYIPALIGGVVTSPAVSSGWYETLIKPSFSPPSFVFGPVWTVLYFLIGLSLFFVWRTAQSEKRDLAIQVFFVQLLVNALWSPVFFGFQALGLSVFVILALLCTIVWTMVVFSRIHTVAMYVLIPYVLWVGFASVLNIFIWYLQ